MLNILEVNVDDLYSGGVFSLIKNVIINKDTNLHIDIAAIEKFEKKQNIDLLASYGCVVHYIGYENNKWKKQIYVYKNLKKLIRAGKYDCVHIHADVANKLLVSGLAAKRAGAKKILLHSHAAGVDGKFRKLKYLFHLMCRYWLKYIGTDYVACSRVAARWMFPNISADKIVLINNGVDLTKFRFDNKLRIKIRKELQIKNEILLGHVGRFCYQKNHDYFIGILKELKKRNISAKLLLVGEGPGEQCFKEKIEKEHLDDMTIFYGTTNKVYELFMAMDVFLLPSHFEGLPIVGVEAQATGLPVVLSDKITRETKLLNDIVFVGIQEKDVATWVDAIEQFEDNKSDRSNAYCCLKKRKFDIQDTINKLLSLYNNI